MEFSDPSKRLTKLSRANTSMLAQLLTQTTILDHAVESGRECLSVMRRNEHPTLVIEDFVSATDGGCENRIAGVERLDPGEAERLWFNIRLTINVGRL